MKKLPLLLGVLVGFSLQAAPGDQPESLQSTFYRDHSLFDLERPNEIKTDSVSFSGIAVQAFKLKVVAELVNPWAPLPLGEAEYNLVRDPIDNKPVGLKIFSIQF